MKSCPRCDEKRIDPMQVLNSLSRTTRTEESTPIYVCNVCGMDEAFEDFYKDSGATPQNEWPLKELANKELVEMLQRQHDLFITNELENINNV